MSSNVSEKTVRRAYRAVFGIPHTQFSKSNKNNMATRSSIRKRATRNTDGGGPTGNKRNKGNDNSGNQRQAGRNSGGTASGGNEKENTANNVGTTNTMPPPVAGKESQTSPPVAAMQPKLVVEDSSSTTAAVTLGRSNGVGRGGGTGTRRPHTTSRLTALMLESSDSNDSDDLMDSSDTTPGTPPPVAENVPQPSTEEDEEIISAITQSTARGGTKASQKSGLSANQKVSLKAVVKTELFPKMKYVRGGSQLAYGSKAAEVVFKGLNMDNVPEDKKKAWWTEARMNFVRSQINVRRNNISGLLKIKFFEVMTKFDGNLPFTLEEMTEDMRVLENPDVDGEFGEKTGFAFVCEHFLPVVVGVVAWKRQVTLKRVMDIANITDEALCWFLLENNFKTWTASWKKKNGQEVEVYMPKYTADANGSCAKKYGGWNQEGSRRWNKIIQVVKESRKLNELENGEVNLEGFDHKYLTWKLNQENEKNLGKKRKVVDQTMQDDDEEMVHGFD